MKLMSVIATIVLLVAFTIGAYADFPVRQSARNDASPVVAYNSTDHEYLVVWSEEFLMGSVWYNSVRAQRVAENGAMIGNLFTVITFAANPAVTYNSAANEYLVGGNPGGNYVCQRVSNTGTLVGSAVTLMNGVNHARLLYNSLGGRYLAIGAALEETPAGSGAYNIKIYSCNVSANLQTVSAPLLIENKAHGPQSLEPAFGAAYAPVATPETPQGRYLLATGRGVMLVMLDSDGAPIDVVYDPAHPGVRYRYIPFNTGNPSAGEFHVDVAYGDHSGYSMSGPAFLVVWADQNNTWSGQAWSGIWGGFVDAGKIDVCHNRPCTQYGVSHQRHRGPLGVRSACRVVAAKDCIQSPEPEILRCLARDTRHEPVQQHHGQPHKGEPGLRENPSDERDRFRNHRHGRPEIPGAVSKHNE